VCRGIGLILIDVVTSLAANLHNETPDLLGHGEASLLPPDQ
jgi:hypothetical protein